MIETKEQLIKSVSEILSTKAFTSKAKDNLLHAILFAFENYHPPRYIKITLQEYIESYLNVLKELNGYATIELSELNEENEASDYFRKSIRRVSSNGNLEYVDEKYIPCENGKLECACKGFAQNSEKQFFSLSENNPIEEFVTIIHEMTHLTEGKYPFLVNANVPLSFEMRKMFSEGRASTKESYIQKPETYIETEYLESSMDFYRFQSKCSYPLYHHLYQILQIIFTDEFLEEMSQNNNDEKDLIEEAKKRFQDIPVYDVFAHIIYILSCKSELGHGELVSAIEECAKCHSRELEWIKEQIMLEKKNLAFLQNSLKENYREEEQKKAKLEKPELLKEEYEKVKEKARRNIEQLFQEGEYEEETYKRELEQLEKEGTFEYYIGLQKKVLLSIKDMQEYTKKSIAECMESVKELESEKIELENNHFALILERVCLKNPSLNASFSFLKETALVIIQDEVRGIPQEDERYKVAKDKMKFLLEIELSRSSNELGVKNNLVS